MRELVNKGVAATGPGTGAFSLTGLGGIRAGAVLSLFRVGRATVSMALRCAAGRGSDGTTLNKGMAEKLIFNASAGTGSGLKFKWLIKGKPDKDLRAS